MVCRAQDKGTVSALAGIHVVDVVQVRSSKEELMIRALLLGAALAFTAAAIANAAVVSAPISTGDSVLIKVAEGCGPGRWRGPGGRCHPFAVGRACPPGYHLGPEGRRCWPN